MGAKVIIERLNELGVTVALSGERLRLEPGSRVPSHLVEVLRQHKSEVVAYLRRQPIECWVLAEWRRRSIPQWRRILQESADQGDAKRQSYARWMLREVLLDPEYTELSK
ncbi:hypothetical protein ACFLX9_02690 [Chloroflexota bacterium]